MPTIVRIGGGGVDTSAVTATASDVKSGVIFCDRTGTIQEGSMPVRDAINIEVNVEESVTREEGYYPSITVKGPTLTGDAKASDVVKGKTFYSNSGAIQTGSLEKRTGGEYAASLGAAIKTFPQGLYTSDIIVKSPPALTGDAEESDVVKGKTFYSNSGTIKTGTLTIPTLDFFQTEPESYEAKIGDSGSILPTILIFYTSEQLKSLGIPFDSVNDNNFTYSLSGIQASCQTYQNERRDFSISLSYDKTTGNIAALIRAELNKPTVGLKFNIAIRYYYLKL